MKTGQCERPAEITTSTGIAIRRYRLDQDDFAWATLEHLLGDSVSLEDNPGRPRQQEQVFRRIAFELSRVEPVNVFANPIHLVWADSAAEGFIVQARIAQKKWFGQFRAIMHTSGRVKRELRKMSPVTRQLTHTGVLILNGRHVFPNEWPRCNGFARRVG